MQPWLGILKDAILGKQDHNACRTFSRICNIPEHKNNYSKRKLCLNNCQGRGCWGRGGTSMSLVKNSEASTDCNLLAKTERRSKHLSRLHRHLEDNRSRKKSTTFCKSFILLVILSITRTSIREPTTSQYECVPLSGMSRLGWVSTNFPDEWSKVKPWLPDPTVKHNMVAEEYKA